MQWSKPAKGNYVSIKEMAAYSIGGIGVQFIAAVVGYIGMSAGSLLIGSVYGITPSHMQIIAVQVKLHNFLPFLYLIKTYYFNHIS